MRRFQLRSPSCHGRVRASKSSRRKRFALSRSTLFFFVNVYCRPILLQLPRPLPRYVYLARIHKKICALHSIGWLSISPDLDSYLPNSPSQIDFCIVYKKSLGYPLDLAPICRGLPRSPPLVNPVSDLRVLAKRRSHHLCQFVCWCDYFLVVVCHLFSLVAVLASLPSCVVSIQCVRCCLGGWNFVNASAPGVDFAQYSDGSFVTIKRQARLTLFREFLRARYE